MIELCLFAAVLIETVRSQTFCGSDQTICDMENFWGSDNHQCMDDNYCHNRQCRNDTQCISIYSDGYRCEGTSTVYADWECTNNCRNDTQCTSGYVCDVGIYSGYCEQCVSNDNCGVGEFCDMYNECGISCNNNNTFCEESTVDMYPICDVTGECVERECYNNTDCDAANYTNYRCDTSDFKSYECVEKCANDTSCYSWEVCNTVSGECEYYLENCINTNEIDYCGGQQVCNTTNGYCERIDCRTDGDCPTDWLCDRTFSGGACYRQCIYDINNLTSYCGATMTYSFYDYVCAESGRCVRQECNNNMDCEIMHNSSWFVCDTVTSPGEAICNYPNCLNTPDWCDHYLGSLTTCNTTTGSCDELACTTDAQCQSTYPPLYPSVYCNTSNGECDADCRESASSCDGWNEWYLNYTGKELGFEGSCDVEDGSCSGPKRCNSTADCTAPYECFTDSDAGICYLQCQQDEDCYGRAGMPTGDNGVVCMEFPSGFGACYPLQDCTTDSDCDEESRYSTKCTDDYCRSVTCDDDATCTQAFDNDLATCLDGFCLNNECLEDDDCQHPFDSCFKGMAKQGLSSGYQCYTWCDYSNTTTEDDDYCTGLYGTDNNGSNIVCERGAPGTANITYCDIFSVSYTSCLLEECDDDATCNRENGDCETRPPTRDDDEPSLEPTSQPHYDEPTSGIGRYHVFGVMGAVVAMSLWIVK